jgi:hypothetical protein
VGDRRVIQEGLTGNEWIITNGLLRAFPGKPVSPEKETPTPAPSGNVTPSGGSTS